MKSEEHYDLIIVGSGIAGSTLAKSLAENDLNVLVLERETTFRDRVRGEAILPWGVVETHALGIYELLTTSCAKEIRWWHDYSGGVATPNQRDLFATTPHQTGFLNFYHPDMQNVLSQAAEATGAEIRRGAKVKDVVPGELPSVILENGDHIYARLVVGADGRNSSVRKCGGFILNRDPERLIVSGVLLENMNLSDDAVYFVINPSIGQYTMVFPLPQGLFRCYLVCARRNHYRPFSGRRRVPDFISACIDTGANAEWFTGTSVAGPLASFEGADFWVKHPFQDGIVLIGDAAATSDPTWGSGLSLALRDVRVLRDHLLTNRDWSRAGNAYAREHNGYYRVVHRLEGWLTELLFDLGPQADLRRERVFQRHQMEPDRMIDFVGVGPESPNNQITRERFFAED